MKHLLTSCAALALSAGVASAATILELESSGVYSTAFPTGSTLSLNGSMAGDAYHDLAPVRDYTVTFSGVLNSMIPETVIPFSGAFTWTGSIASLATITPVSATAGFISSVLGSGNYTSFASAGTSFSLDYAVELIGDIRDAFVTEFGTYNGDYNIAATFTAPVPIPASLPLALTAFGLMGFAARRRKSDKLAA